jgi:hypothetical protein
MNMLRHNYVSDDNKAVTPADLLEGRKKQIAPSRFAKHRRTTVTISRDEMQVSGIVLSPKSPRHCAKLKRSREDVCDG